MKKYLFFAILVSFIVMTFCYYSTKSFSANELLLSNIEAFAGTGEETPTEITSCVQDGDVRADPDATTLFTICNSQTTSTLIYFCSGTKKGYQVTWGEYKCKVKK